MTAYGTNATCSHVRFGAAIGDKRIHLGHRETDGEFDGETKGLDLPWSAERLDRISRGEDDPTHEELQQWRRAKWRKLTASSPTWFAWIVPLRIDQDIVGYALFVGALDGDPEETPYLRGVFDSLEEAEAELATEGSVDDTVEGREAPQV